MRKDLETNRVSKAPRSRPKDGCLLANLSDTPAPPSCQENPSDTPAPPSCQGNPSDTGCSPILQWQGNRYPVITPHRYPPQRKHTRPYPCQNLCQTSMDRDWHTHLRVSYRVADPPDPGRKAGSPVVGRERFRRGGNRCGPDHGIGDQPGSSCDPSPWPATAPS